MKISRRKKALQVLTKKSPFKYTNWCKGPAGLAGQPQTAKSVSHKSKPVKEIRLHQFQLFNISSKCSLIMLT